MPPLRARTVELGLVGLLQTFDRKPLVGGERGCITSLEVVVRRSEVFVRPLAHEEAVSLKRKAKRAKHFSTRERAAILLASNVGNSELATSGKEEISSGCPP